jgi:hypothetical protein
MTETALKILEKFGLPTLVAVGLGGLLVYQTMGASEERAQHTVLLIDQISDLREKVARLEGKCR